MQRRIFRRLHFTYPGGAAAWGLLFLRLAIGGATIVYGAYSVIAGNRPEGQLLVAWLAIVCGGALVAGFLTPAAAAVAGLNALREAIRWRPEVAMDSLALEVLMIQFVITSTALILLGPGALSLDSRINGRRELSISGSSRTSQQE